MTENKRNLQEGGKPSAPGIMLKSLNEALEIFPEIRTTLFESSDIEKAREELLRNERITGHHVLHTLYHAIRHDQEVLQSICVDFVEEIEHLRRRYQGLPAALRVPNIPAGSYSRA